MLVLVCMKRSDWFTFMFIVCTKRSYSFIFILLHNIKIVIGYLNFEQVKCWTSINLINNIVIVLVCGKCSKFITSEENIISFHQLLSCLPFFFVFSSEVPKSVIKVIFTELVFQNAVIMLYPCVVRLFHREFPRGLLL